MLLDILASSGLWLWLRFSRVLKHRRIPHNRFCHNKSILVVIVVVIAENFVLTSIIDVPNSMCIASSLGGINRRISSIINKNASGR